MLAVAQIHTDNGVILGEGNGTHAAGKSADHARVVFVKADGKAVSRRNEQLAAAVGDVYAHKTVALIEIDRNEAVFPHIGIGGQAGALDNAVRRHHAEILLALIVGDADHRRDLFFLFDGQEIDNVHALRRARALRDFIAFQAVHLAE